MPAGTIALTNNSATVTGTGTSFTTELKVGDFIGVIVGSAPYTAVVGAIASNTSLTMTVPFNGPTSSGLAWNAVPASLKIAITQQVLNDMGTVARGMILEKANWQKIFSSDQSVTVTMPDRTTFTGPSWGYLATQLATALKVRGQIPSTGIDFNTYGPTSDYEGVWYLSSGSQASGSTNMPEANIGVLEIFRGGGFQGTQRYTTRYGVVYSRNLTATWTAANPNVWGPWVNAANNIAGVFFSGDVNTLLTPGDYGVTASATNIPVAITGRMTVETRTPTPTSTFGAIIQTFKTFSTAAANKDRVFQRSFDGNSTWTAWAESLTSNSFGTIAGTAAQGNDSRLNTIDGKSGGQLTTGSSLSVYGPATKNTTTGQFNESPAFKMNINGTGTASQMYSQWTSVEYVGNENYAQLRHVWGSTNVTWKFSWSGTATAQNGSWTNGSDSRIKDGLEVITGALNKVKQLNGYTGNRDGKSFTGVIAQELQKVLPEAVFNSGLYTLQTDINGLKAGETIADLLSVAYGDTVGLLVEAIKELSGIVDKQNTVVTELQKRMKAIDGLDA